jgi:peptide/nickel transport system permease protein
MFKYVLKRLGLALVVLLGVSLIIYFLVRLMPTNYLENKFSAQIQQGTITLDQLDDFQKRYGLYMPEAYVSIELDGYETFEKDAKVKKYEDVQNELVPYAEFYAGRYESKKDIILEINKNGSYRILDESEDTAKVLESGTFTAVLDSITFSRSGEEVQVDAQYREANVWNKFLAVLSGYFSWLGNMLKGDLGDSFLYQMPVGQVIADHMWISFLISLVALVFQFAIAIPLGIISATRQYSVVDYSVTVITMIGISLPSFFFAALLIKVFSSWLGWFPASGLVSAGSASTGIMYMFDMLHHLVLPMLVLIVLSIGGLMRYTRTNMLEVLNSDYIRTARSKGLSEKKVIYVHAFRNTMIPLMTLLAGILPSLFGGAMITEEVFAIDGIGRLAYKALQQGDVPFIMGYNMFLAVLTVIGTLLSDLMYAVVDPRVKLSK